MTSPPSSSSPANVSLGVDDADVDGLKRPLVGSETQARSTYFGDETGVLRASLLALPTPADAPPPNDNRLPILDDPMDERGRWKIGVDSPLSSTSIASSSAPSAPSLATPSEDLAVLSATSSLRSSSSSLTRVFRFFGVLLRNPPVASDMIDLKCLAHITFFFLKKKCFFQCPSFSHLGFLTAAASVVVVGAADDEDEEAHARDRVVSIASSSSSPAMTWSGLSLSSCAFIKLKKQIVRDVRLEHRQDHPRACHAH